MANSGDCTVPLVVEDIPGLIKVYSDGSVIREEAFDGLPSLVISKEDDALYKDVVFDEEVELWARLYLPPMTKTNTNTRVPVLFYFHASGFCVCSPSNPVIHNLCTVWAAKLGVIIISVKYRLAPEHRLPAAYHDSIAALKWFEEMIKGGAVSDPWLQSHADFSKIFVMGESAGGNIANHLGMWAARENGMGIKINGMILLYPFFGGEDRMPSEGGGRVEESDALWRLALPVGNNTRDHPFCNPIQAGEEGVVAVSSLSLPPMLFVIGGLDILRDKQLQYCEFLKNCGKEVEVLLFDDEDHCFTNYNDRHSSLQVHRRISDFIKRNGGGFQIRSTII